MTKNIKIRLIRLTLSAVLFCAGVIADTFVNIPWISLAVFITSYLVAGYDVILKAFDGIKTAMLLDENFLMTVATVGAFAIGEKFEAVAVMIFYGVGELFSDIAVRKSRITQKSLMDLRPDYANLLTGDKEEKVSPEEVEIGEYIAVYPGEKIPLDGVVTEGGSSVDVSAVLGESLPEYLTVGEKAIAGCIVRDGSIKIKVTSKYADSTVSKILKLSESASAKKTKTEKFVTRFARVYTPIVVSAAVLLCVIPWIITGNFSEWFHRSLMFLVVSCPCALVVSVPLTYFAASGGAAKCGILFKGSRAIESLYFTDTVCFDKTGTLTDGDFTIGEVCSDKLTKTQLINLAAAIEKNSSHPIAVSISKFGNCEGMTVKNEKNYAGLGVSAEVDGTEYFAGTEKLMKEIGIDVKNKGAVHIAKRGEYLGSISLADKIKDGLSENLTELRRCGIKKIVMLTGASEHSAQDVAEQLFLDEYRFEQMPEDKLKSIERYIESGAKVAYVGDGINDVPCLSRADTGISMGIAGSDAAIEASDVTLTNDNVGALVTAIKIAKSANGNAKENIIISLLVKVAVMVLCALGIVGMWTAVFADVGVCILAVANASRLFSVRKYKR